MGCEISGFIEGRNRPQSTLFPERIDDYVAKTDTSGKRGKGEYKRRDFHYIAEDDEYECPAGEREIYRFTRNESGKNIRRYWSSACKGCRLKSKCTPGDYRRNSRWEREAVVEAAEVRLANFPDATRIRRATVEHPFAMLKHWMGSTPAGTLPVFEWREKAGGIAGCCLSCVRTHPHTGRNALYVNAGFVGKIVELSLRESDGLLAMLYDHVAYSVNIQCRVLWAANTVVFRDNRVVQHHAAFDYFPEVRRGDRVTVVGEVPVLAEESQELDCLSVWRSVYESPSAKEFRLDRCRFHDRRV